MRAMTIPYRVPVALSAANETSSTAASHFHCWGVLRCTAVQTHNSIVIREDECIEKVLRVACSAFHGWYCVALELVMFSILNVTICCTFMIAYSFERSGGGISVSILLHCIYRWTATAARLRALQ